MVNMQIIYIFIYSSREKCNIYRLYSALHLILEYDAEAASSIHMNRRRPSSCGKSTLEIILLQWGNLLSDIVFKNLIWFNNVT